jgi:hypothetical protein
MSQIVYLKTPCERCSGHIEYPSELTGQSIECPHCQQVTSLPPPLPPSFTPPPPPIPLPPSGCEEIATKVKEFAKDTAQVMQGMTNVINEFREPILKAKPTLDRILPALTSRLKGVQLLFRKGQAPAPLPTATPVVPPPIPPQETEANSYSHRPQPVDYDVTYDDLHLYDHIGWDCPLDDGTVIRCLGTRPDDKYKEGGAMVRAAHSSCWTKE